MQELTASIKRPNLRIMGIEGEEVQAKGIRNIFNKIITKNFPTLEKTMPIQIQKASRTPNRLDQNRTTQQHIIIKITSTENRERILKAVRQKKHVSQKGKPLRITADFSTETVKARRAWSEVFRALNENNFNPRILYPAKLSLKIDGATKDFYDKQKLKQHRTLSHHYKRFFKESCTQKMKAYKTMKGQEVPNHRRRKGKTVESNIDLAAHNQTLQQQRHTHTHTHTHTYTHVHVHTHTKQQQR
jgi:DNA-binding transcriptional ArsR family regulator